MSNWQPIESAPKDGSFVDLWVFCHDPAWSPEHSGIEHGNRLVDCRWLEDSWHQYGEKCWFEDGSSGAQHYTVSHWMHFGIPEASA